MHRKKGFCMQLSTTPALRQRANSGSPRHEREVWLKLTRDGDRGCPTLQFINDIDVTGCFQRKECHYGQEIRDLCSLFWPAGNPARRDHFLRHGCVQLCIQHDLELEKGKWFAEMLHPPGVCHVSQGMPWRAFFFY